MGQVFVGHDWAEDRHDIEIRDDKGRRLGGARLAEGVEGVARFHALLAEQVADPDEVVVATETDRGLFVRSLVAAGYVVQASAKENAQLFWAIRSGGANFGIVTSFEFAAWQAARTRPAERTWLPDLAKLQALRVPRCDARHARAGKAASAAGPLPPPPTRRYRRQRDGRTVCFWLTPPIDE